MVEEGGWQLLDWDTEEEHPEFVDNAVVVLRGTSRVPMDVEFHDLPVGIVAYDYWPVEVRGRPQDPTIEVETAWVLERQESDFPKGTVGFVLMGATKRSKHPADDGLNSY